MQARELMLWIGINFTKNETLTVVVFYLTRFIDKKRGEGNIRTEQFNNDPNISLMTMKFLIRQLDQHKEKTPAK